MFDEIVNKYEKFSDALISEIVYREFDSLTSVEIVVNCMNALNDYEHEIIKLTFSDIVSFQFMASKNQSSTVINSALLENNDGITVFDFFPLIYGNDVIKENKNSDLKIKCKEVRYTTLA